MRSRLTTRAAITLAGAGCVVASTGCVDRLIRVTSDPPGAMVWVNDTPIGRTPAETSFVHYGTFDVRLQLDGYEPVGVARKAEAPLYEYPGPDLIAEALPWPIEHTVEWHFDLEPALERGADRDAFEAGLIERARELSNELSAEPGSD